MEGREQKGGEPSGVSFNEERSEGLEKKKEVEVLLTYHLGRVPFIVVVVALVVELACGSKQQRSGISRVVLHAFGFLVQNLHGKLTIFVLSSSKRTKGKNLFPALDMLDGFESDVLFAGRESNEDEISPRLREELNRVESSPVSGRLPCPRLRGSVRARRWMSLDGKGHLVLVVSGERRNEKRGRRSSAVMVLDASR